MKLYYLESNENFLSDIYLLLKVQKSATMAKQFKTT